jgi:hypothetical protein
LGRASDILVSTIFVRHGFITIGGRHVDLQLLDRESPAGRDARFLRFRVTPDGGDARTVQVVLPVFDLTKGDLVHRGISLPEDREYMLAVLSLLQAVQGYLRASLAFVNLGRGSYVRLSL